MPGECVYVLHTPEDRMLYAQSRLQCDCLLGCILWPSYVACGSPLCPAASATPTQDASSRVFCHVSGQLHACPVMTLLLAATPPACRGA